LTNAAQKFDDQLLEDSRTFECERLKQGLFLNSVPKAGTHLLRNILLMFVPKDQTYSTDFIDAENVRKHLSALIEEQAYFSWGHLAFSEFTAPVLRKVRKLLLIRDPYDYVLSLSRFLLSEHPTNELSKYIKKMELTASEVMRIVIFGVYGPHDHPGVEHVYFKNALAWLGEDTYLIRFEDLQTHVADPTTEAADEYFTKLLEAAGIAKPNDWSTRLKVGSDPRLSWTSRSYVIGPSSLPEKLGSLERSLVDCAAPRLRALLGYDSY